ncbi:MAG: hypothetical protein ACOCTT_00765 [archaeon]
MKNNVKSLRDTVKKVLREDERARNSDKWLVIMVLREMGFDIYVDYHQMDDMPSFESITRCRRKIQEKGKYLANDDVRNEREKNEDEMNEINRWWKE